MQEDDLLKYDKDYVLEPKSISDKYIDKDKIIYVKSECKHTADDLVFDILKYWRIVRRWATDTHDELNTSDLELLLFLYREEPFDNTFFLEASAVMSWDNGRLKRMQKEGWITTVTIRNKETKRLLKRYTLSKKSKYLCNSIYNKLLQKETISEDPRYNKLFKKSASYSEKIYRNAIKKMNEKTLKKLSNIK